MPYSKVSLLGVDSLWGDCIFIPANPQHKHAKWLPSDLTTYDDIVELLSAQAITS